MSFFSTIKRGLSGFGKKVVGAARSVGKFVDQYGRKIAKGVGTAGSYIQKYAPVAGEIASVIAPEYAGQIGQAVNTAQQIGGALQKGSDLANKGLDIYDKVKGIASQQGLINGSPDVNGNLTTPSANSVAHESRSNAGQKGSMLASRKRKAISQNPASEIVSQDLANVKAPGKPVASGPLAGMSSEMAADTITVNKNKEKEMQKGPDLEKMNMAERYSELKKGQNS